MWGVGKVTQEALTHLNIYTFKDMSQVPVMVLEQKFGEHGLKMHQLSLGIDGRDVIPEHDVKSIGHEETFLQDIIKLDVARKELLALANKVARRMRRGGVTGKTVTLKVKYSDFVQTTRSISLPKTTDDSLEIYATICCLLERTEVGKRPVRLLGITLSQLSFHDSRGQLSLFQDSDEAQKRKRLNTALDSLYEKHGDKSVRPGTLFTD